MEMPASGTVESTTSYNRTLPLKMSFKKALLPKFCLRGSVAASKATLISPGSVFSVKQSNEDSSF